MASRAGNPYEAWDKMVLLTNQDVGIRGDLPLEKGLATPKKETVEENNPSLFDDVLYHQSETGAETSQQMFLKNSKGNPEKTEQQNSEKVQKGEMYHKILQKDFKQKYFEQSNEKKPFEVKKITVSSQMKKRSGHHGEKYTRKQRSEIIGINQIKSESNSEKGLKVAVPKMDSAEPENADKIVKGKKHRKYLFFKRNI